MYDTILAKSPACIFRPGGVAGGIVVTAWAQVQAFIALREGAVTVYVDDSIAAAHVPAASGVTDCQGRVEIRPFRPDSNNFTTLTVDDGATLKALYRLADTIFLQLDTQGATPALDFDYSGAAFPTLYVEDQAAIGTSTTATQPACVIPAGQELNWWVTGGAEVIAQTASAIVQVSAGATFGIFARNANFVSTAGSIPSTWAQGPGRFTMGYDANTARESNTPGTVLGPGINFTNVATSITVAIDGDTNVLGTTTQTVFVRKSGSDLSGNGTREFPYLTIQKALSTILDATTAKRYVVDVGVGAYADPFLIKPWCAVRGEPNTSNFFGTVEITAAADTCGFDPAAYAGAGFNVAWYSHLVFANHQTWDEIAVGNSQCQVNWFDVDFNGGFGIKGPGTSGVDNFTMDDCLVYSGGDVKGVHFFWTNGGTQFLGGTVTIEGGPPGALGATTWLAQNTAVGAASNPTAVHVLWAAPSPAVAVAALDWCNSNVVGLVTLDGANTGAKFAGPRPATIVQTNGAPAPAWQAITIELIFAASANNVLAGLQAAGTIPTTGTMTFKLEGFGGSGGGGGGSGGTAAGGAGNGGAGAGGCMYSVATFDHDLSHRLDIGIGAGGAGGAGGPSAVPPANAGGDGGPGLPTTATDFVTGVVHGGLAGSAGGFGANNASFQDRAGGGPVPGTFRGPGFEGNISLPYYGGCGNGSGNAGENGSSGPLSLEVNIPGGVWVGGVGGVSLVNQGGGGGGGGMGPRGNGANGASGTAGAGAVGGSPAANSGGGAGGGSGGASGAFAGGAGGNGSAGWCKLTAVIQ